MVSGRTLTTNFATRFITKYTNTGDLINPTNVKDNLRYLDILKKFTDGIGAGKTNLQYYKRRTLVNSTETLNLDGGLINRWGDSLNFEDIKLGVIFNRETTGSNRFLQVNFKDEKFYIGPQGFRIFYENSAGGVLDISSSGVIAEGNLVVSSNANITYDLILIGSGGSIIPGYALWLDAETTVYQDGSQTLAVEGDTVQEWVDKSSNGHILAQTTLAKKPIFRQSAINGQPALEFDGTDDVLFKASAIFSGAKGAVFAVVNVSDVAGSGFRNVLASDDGTNNKIMEFRALREATNEIQMRFDDGTVDNNFDGDSVISAGESYLPVWISDGSKYRIRKNGNEEILTFSLGSNNGNWFSDITGLTTISVGAKRPATPLGLFKGLIATVLVYDDIDLTDEEIDEVEAALANKYGITLT